MPMPNPGKEESKQDFIARFMSDPEMIKDYPDEKQRLAVAYSTWDENHKDIQSADAQDPGDMPPKEESKKHIVCSFAKELDNSKSPDRGFWVWVTREINDTSGDFIKIDGIDYSTYHNPIDGKYLTVLTSHQKTLPNGEPPIIGRVEEFLVADSVVDGKTVKGLAAYITWACDNDGNITPLAKKWKDLTPSYVNTVSIGFLVDKRNVQKNKSGGLDISKCNLYEVSLVPIPDNTSARIIKELRDKFKEVGIELDSPEAQEDPSAKNNMDAMMNCIDSKLRSLVDPLTSVIMELHGANKEMMVKYQELCDKVSTIESAIVVLSSPMAKSHKGGQPKSEIDEKALNELQNSLIDIKKSLLK